MRRTAIVLMSALVLFVPGCGSDQPKSQTDLARADATRFLDHFVDANGRVVRRDQGGDTVSEGQSYALLLSVAVGDRDRFKRVWAWTQHNLQRPDGLLSWHWQDGRVTDRQPSADADLDAAHALVLAGRRFKEPALLAQARRIGRAVRAQETISTPIGGVLAAGPWAASKRLTNPSYADPRAMHTLAGLGDAAGWQRLRRADGRMIGSLIGGGTLPPDWAKVTTQGFAAPTASPGAQAGPGYSFDAARVPIRFAGACAPAERRVAASLWPRLSHEPALLPRALGDGAMKDATPSAVGLAASAAAAAAAGKAGDADHLLAQASGREKHQPTYYGSALVALTRVTVMTRMLGRCG